MKDKEQEQSKSIRISIEDYNKVDKEFKPKIEKRFGFKITHKQALSYIINSLEEVK